ncbi:head decoration protein [Saccharibacillus brassicae]|uniref:Head decoration protein n=1 Tax=Saccharibacillus brassicae TaxID=2583377 RepID=A0A4Y6V497_SACBS|nr:head decoration protein [Saccharibacillus brassicae]QDH23461.1 head decoration protein [Saccharibacillus brassicae]
MSDKPYYGVPGPGVERVQSFTEVLASTDLQAKIPGGVLLKKGQGVLKKGQVLGRVTAEGEDKGKFLAYKPSATDGTQKAVCILDNDKDTDYADIGASAWIAGIFEESKLTGIDEAAKTALKLCYFM